MPNCCCARRHGCCCEMGHLPPSLRRAGLGAPERPDCLGRPLPRRRARARQARASACQAGHRGACRGLAIGAAHARRASPVYSDCSFSVAHSQKPRRCGSGGNGAGARRACRRHAPAGVLPHPARP
eukprot:11028483-Alexandrium_andersonii.AAC.1